MNQKNIFIISGFISIALIGIIILQFFWMFESVKERKEHLHQHIVMAMNDFTLQLSYDTVFISNCNNFNLLDKKSKNEILQKLKNKLEELSIRSEFEFAIINKKNQTLLFTNSTVLHPIEYFSFRKEFASSNQKCQYLFLIQLTNSERYIYHTLYLWISLVIFSIILLLFGFFLLIKIVVNQKKLSSMKNDFINNMTHELKTPISTISAAGEMLLKENVIENREKTTKYLRIIISENQRLKRLVERVLQIAILDKKALKLKLSKANFHEIITNCVESSKVLLLSKSGSITVDLKAENYEIQCDFIHITNVVNNLIENAIKYSETPEISIETYNSNKGVICNISDNGLGISKKDQARIFEKFYRTQKGDVHDVKGFGLGLYYVKKIIEEHGGTINVQSDLNQGSIFKVFLPIIH